MSFFFLSSVLIILTGEVSTFAGSLKAGYADGSGRSAQFNYPGGICFDEVDRCLLVCDHENNKLRRISLTGTSPTSCLHPVISLLTRSKEMFRQYAPSYAQDMSLQHTNPFLFRRLWVGCFMSPGKVISYLEKWMGH